MADAATITPINEEGRAADGSKRKIPRSATRFPVYSLGDSVAVARAIHERGGGSADHDNLAVYLGYKSFKNGSYMNRVPAPRIFGLITGQGPLQLAPSLRLS